MAKMIEESLLDSLLKSHYPLTYYLYRQQEFLQFFSTTQTSTITTPSGITSVFTYVDIIPTFILRIRNRRS